MNNFNIFKRMFNNDGSQAQGGTQRGPGSQIANFGQSSQHLDSDFEDLYQDVDSNYNYLEYQYNAYGQHYNLNYPKYYDDLSVRKWERVISEENVDDEECKEYSQEQNIGSNNDYMVYNKIIYTPRTGHAVVEHAGLFYLFAGADSDSRTNDMY